MPCEPFVDQLEIELLGPEMADLFCCVSELCLLEYRHTLFALENPKWLNISRLIKQYKSIILNENCPSVRHVNWNSRWRAARIYLFIPK